MKIKTMQILLYLSFFFGIAIVFAAAVIPSVSGFIVIFKYIGVMIVLGGIAASIFLLRLPVCPDCSEINCNCV